MPRYVVKCLACEMTRTVRLSFASYDAVRGGTDTVRCSCGGTATLEFDPSSVGFSLKDGVSGGWITKAGKENAYRKARRGVMTQRERDHVSKATLVPNHKGNEAPTWADARDEAYQSTYQKVRGEHGDKTAAAAAAESAKTYDDHVKQEGSR